MTAAVPAEAGGTATGIGMGAVAWLAARLVVEIAAAANAAP
jgi:hypothetical protein